MATTTAQARLADTQDQFLRAIEDAQDASLRFASLLAEQWQQLPNPAQSIDAGFAFAGRVLDLQRRYALGLVGAVAPREPAVTE